MPTLTTHSVDGPVAGLSTLEVTDANGDTILYNFGDYDGDLSSVGVGVTLSGVSASTAFYDPDAPITSDIIALFSISAEILNQVESSFTLSSEVQKEVANDFEFNTVLFDTFSWSTPAQRVEIEIQR